MTDKDTLMNLIDEYAEVRHINGCWVYNTKTAAARQAVIEALSGVQALSAAPGEPSDAEIDEFIDLHCWDANGRRSIVRHAIARWGAAPTTRPAPQQEAQYDHGPQAETVEEAARDVGKWLNERPNRPLDLRHVAMLAHYATAPQQEAQAEKVQAITDLAATYASVCINNPERKHTCWLNLKKRVAEILAAPPPAPAPLSDDVVRDAARYRRLREHEGADGLIRSDCRGLYLPQRDALDSAVDALLFTTPSQRGEIAGDGKPCNNEHDPDCRWPDCRCRERERMAAAIDAALAAQGGRDAG